MFTSYPTYGRYRTLRLSNPMMVGEDVFALQTALKAFGCDPGALDGVLGSRTHSAIRRAQELLNITVDGLAGGVTQTKLVHVMSNKSRAKYGLPKGLEFGQLSHESGCRVGNYSPIRSNRTYDAGVAQRNTQFTSAKIGFNVPDSIDALGANLSKYHKKFIGVRDEARRWALAAGAWNAPAYTCYIAREEGATGVRVSETARPSGASRNTLEGYMRSATVYMEL